ncbi:TRAP transporter substrate-binding protein [Paenibacillus zeirhizosphaerae]
MMNKQKRTSLLFVLLAAIVTITGCSTGGSDNQEAGTAGQGGAATYNFRLAEAHPADYPTTKGDMKFAELVKEKSGGRITIDVFPSAQLGEEKSAIEQVQLGAIEFTRVSTGPMAEFNKDFGVFSLPYIFNDDDHVWRFLQSETGTKLLDSLETSGLKGLTYYSSGSRSFYSTKPVAKLEDLKGMKIRVIENKLNIEIMDALGANATPMAYGEVYSALQTGIIDAAENNYPSYYSSKHFEIAQNYILDGHQRVPEVLLVSKQVWDTLSPEDKAILKEAAVESTEYQREEWAKYEKESEEKVRAGGAVITEVSDADAWKNAVKPVIEKYRTEYGEVLNAIEQAKTE